MPILPSNSKCSELGCKDHRSKFNTYCMNHGGRNSYNDSDSRTESNSMYQSAQWKQTRVVQLSRQPLCQSCLCEGRVTAANHVDHVFPWTKIGKYAFSRNLFQSLCIHCHSAKTVHEQRGIYLHYTEGGPVELTKNDYQWAMRKDIEWT